MTRITYHYNADCLCEWCLNGGHIPQGTPNNGHSFGYAEPHIPTTRVTLTEPGLKLGIRWPRRGPASDAS